MTEQLHFHFSLSCIREGNGNPLQCSCLENPRDGGAWGAAVYGVAQSQTRLKRLSSSSSSHTVFHGGCTHLHPRQQCANAHQRLFVACLMITILTGVRWHLIVVLICISLMISNAEHLFVCLLAICALVLESVPYKDSSEQASDLGSLYTECGLPWWLSW